MLSSRTEPRAERLPDLTDVRGTKGSIFYRAHSYHTKVPVEILTRFLEHYTDPGDVVTDPFCGSGMTGVAALLTGRHAVLSDLSPAAVHIARGYTTPVDSQRYRSAADQLLDSLGWIEDELYGGGESRLEYTVWSDVFGCPDCDADLVVWDAAVDLDEGTVATDLWCPHGHGPFLKRDLTWRRTQPVQENRSVPGAKRRMLCNPDPNSIADADRKVSHWYPTAPWEAWREMWRGQHRDQGIETAADFFTRRNLAALAALWAEIAELDDEDLRAAFRFTFTSIVNRASRRYQWHPKRPTNVLSSTMYVASLNYEFNVFSLFRRKLSTMASLYEALKDAPGSCEVHQGSATSLRWLPDSSVDYVFTDPPFGSNIFYADSSFLWEAWLGEQTDVAAEAVVNKRLSTDQGGTDLDGYGDLLAEAVSELARVLRPNAWMSLQFHNSDDAVWSSVQRAIERGGLAVAGAVLMDKSQASFKGLRHAAKGERVANFDLVMHLTPASAGLTVRSVSESELAQVLEAHLVQAAPAQRSTPWLHAVAMRWLLSNEMDLNGWSFDAIERLCRKRFELEGNAWRGPASKKEIDVPSFARRNPLPDYVSASKGSALYQAHTYPTKIPPEAIIPFIEASTTEGGLVADPFSGSGMTGVAAMLSGRRAVLSDLSPGATHISRNHTRRVAPDRLHDELQAMDIRWMRRVERDLYEAELGSDRLGLTRHTIWSEVYACPACDEPVVLWEVAEPDRPMPRIIQCSRCRAEFDRTGTPSVDSVPVQVVIKPDAGGKLVTEDVNESDLERIDRLSRRRVRHWVPRDRMDTDREMYIRSALHLRGIRTVADFFAHRPKLALSKLWAEIAKITDPDVREAFEFAFTNTAWHASRMRRFNARGGQRPLTGTLFIPQLVSEPNVFEVFRHQLSQLGHFYGRLPNDLPPVEVRTSSATNLSWLPDASVDYVFTDPPFGNNIHYADCNIVWEAWLGTLTDNDAEIVVNKSRRVDKGGKSVGDYERLLAGAFSEAKRIVRPDGRVSIVFHNSDDAVWSALLDAVETAGLHQAEVSILDKGQRSQKGYKVRRGELVPFYDLVMTFTPNKGSVPRLNGAGEVALDVVKDHLAVVNGSSPAEFRALDYLYSVAVAGVVRAGRKPVGLSLRAFETLCNDNLAWDGLGYTSPADA